MCGVECLLEPFTKHLCHIPGREWLAWCIPNMPGHLSFSQGRYIVEKTNKYIDFRHSVAELAQSHTCLHVSNMNTRTSPLTWARLKYIQIGRENTYVLLYMHFFPHIHICCSHLYYILFLCFAIPHLHHMYKVCVSSCT